MNKLYQKMNKIAIVIYTKLTFLYNSNNNTSKTFLYCRFFCHIITYTASFTAQQVFSSAYIVSFTANY